MDFQEAIKTLRSSCVLRTFQCGSRKKLLNRLSVKQLSIHKPFIALIPQPLQTIHSYYRMPIYLLFEIFVLVRSRPFSLSSRSHQLWGATQHSFKLIPGVLSESKSNRD